MSDPSNPSPRVIHPLPSLPAFQPLGHPSPTAPPSALDRPNTTAIPVSSGSDSVGGGGAINPAFARSRGGPGYGDDLYRNEVFPSDSLAGNGNGNLTGGGFEERDSRKLRDRFDDADMDRERFGGGRGREGYGTGNGLEREDAYWADRPLKRRFSPSPSPPSGPSHSYPYDRDRDSYRYEPRPRLSGAPPPHILDRERPAFIRERSPGGAPNGGRSRSRSRSRSRELPRRDRDIEREDYERERERNRERERYDDRYGPTGGYGSDRRRLAALGVRERSRPPREAEKKPDELEAVLTFREFAMWAKEWNPELIKEDEAAVSKAGQRKPLSAAYAGYRSRYTSRQLWALFLAHRDEAWFKERYSDDPVLVAQREAVSRLGRSRAVQKFIKEVEEGLHENVNFDAEPHPSHPATRGPETIDDRELCHIPPSRKQIFIRALPVTATRTQLEVMLKAAGKFEYLAIGEPIQKKAFHRAAWGQYSQDEDMALVVGEVNDKKIDGFPLSVTENAADHINKVRHTPGILSTTRRMEIDRAQARALVLRLEEGLKEDSNPHVKLENSETSAGDVPVEDVKMEEAADPPKQEVKASMDDIAQSKAIAGPAPERLGSEAVQEAIIKVLEKRGLLNVKDLSEEDKRETLRIELDHWLLYLRRGLHTCYYCISSHDHEEELYRKCIRHLRQPVTAISEKAISLALATGTEGGAELPKEGDEQDEEQDNHMDEHNEMADHADHVPVVSKASGMDVEMDQREFRKLVGSEQRWAEYIDKKIQLLIARDTVNPVDYNGKDLEAEKAKICAPLIKLEEESKYRCRQCAKLFKAPEFLYKHIPTKHPELFEKVIADVKYFNSFCLDPQHLVPHRFQPASVNDKLPHESLLPQQAVTETRPITRNNGRMARRIAATGGPNLLGRVGGYASDQRGSTADLRPSLDRALDDERLLNAMPAMADDPRASRGRLNYRDLDAPVDVQDGGGLPY